jgi:site-specific recombinase XerD
LDENLWKNVPPIRVPEKTKPHLNLVEIQQLVGHMRDNEFMLHLVLVAFGTGFRLGELRNLHFSDVDWTNRMLYARNTAQFTTKSKKERSVPMNGSVLAILTQRYAQASPTDLVFGLNGSVVSESYVSRRFKKYVLRAGLNEKLNFHSLRHSFASNLVASGASLAQVQKLMGHSSYNTTLQYAHLQPQNLQHLVDVLNPYRDKRWDIKSLEVGWMELTPNPKGQTLVDFKDMEKYHVEAKKDGKLLLYPRYNLDGEIVK